MLTIRIGVRAFSPIIILPGLLLLFCSVCIAGHLVLSRALNDQTEFHLPTIRQFARELPAPNFRSYASATTPGYHVALAAVARYLTGNVDVLRLTGSFFSVALLVLLIGHLRKGTDNASVIRLCGPLLCSIYFLSSAAWILPDNAEWLGVLAILVLASRPTFDAKTIATAGIVLAALVFVRQAAVWTTVVLWVAAYTSDDAGIRGRRTLLMIAATLPALAVVVGFAALWGGLVPPLRQEDHALQFTLAAPSLIFALAGSIGWAFLAAVPDLRARLEAQWRIIAAGAALGLVLSLIPETSYDYFAGRGTGLWNLTKYFPAPLGHSPLIVGLATLGGATLAAFVTLLDGRARILFAVTLAAFISASSFDVHAWQRYYEPLLLMVFAMSVVNITPGRLTRHGVVSLTLLSVAELTVTVLAFVRP